MKRDSEKLHSSFSLKGWLFLFLAVMIVAVCSILLYVLVLEGSGGDKAISAWVTFLGILVLTTLYVVIDFIRRKLTVERPVKRILAGTERIMAGDFSVRLRPLHVWGKYDEYDIITENLNRMAEALSKNEVLKTDFIASVSHEIKTPLVVIENYAVLLQDESLSAEERQAYAKSLLDATRRLATLTANILKLNKLEHQTISTARKWVQLDRSLTESILQFADLIDAKGLELSCEINEAGIVTDESYPEIIWNNLLSNAIKFTPAGGQIRVSLREDGNSVVFTVSDTGCGMTAEVGSRIFEKFYQGDTSHSQEGNGLGLALVKKTVDLIGGEISVSSELGKGSTFVVKLRRK